MADLHVMYQPLGGGWVKLGTQTGGGRGVVAESIRLEGDRGEGGCLSASFKLKQDPRWIATQMEKATPIVVMDGAEPIWSGRIAETPMTFGEDDIEVGVNAQGWWQHLKDDCTDREWVIDDLSRFFDARQSAGAVLGTTGLYAAAQVQVGDGIITLMNPNGTVLSTNGRANAALDLGENNLARRIIVTYESSNIAANTSLTVGCGTTASITDPAHVGGGGGAVIANNAGASGTATVTPTTPSRFVILGLVTTLGHTAGADEWFKITSVKIFTDAADESGNASILKASTIIGETLDECCPNISPDRSRITTTALSLPQFPGSPGWRFAEELIRQANAPHGYLARLTPDPVPVFEYGPIPTDYRFVLGEGQYTLLEPAAQSLHGVANRVITEFEDAAGVRSYAESGGLENSLHYSQLSNGTFDVNTTGWSAAAGTLLRDTSPVYEGAGSLRMTSSGIGVSEAQTANEIAVAPSTEYRLKFAFYRRTALTVSSIRPTSNGATSLTQASSATELAALAAAMSAQAVNTWQVYTLRFRTNADTTNIGIFLQFTGSPATTAVANIDSVQITSELTTLLGRRGFQRTFLRPMSQRSTLATAEAIADLELDAAQFPPFKGTLGLVGRVNLKGGGSMDVSHIPGHGIGENVLISNLHDSNSQGLGRIGNITSAVYDHDKRMCVVGIDRDLRFISELRARLSLFAR